MANYDYLTIEVKGNPTKATLEKIMKDITGADYEHLVGDTYEHVYLEYSKDKNKVLIHSKSQFIGRYIDNLIKLSIDHPILRFVFSVSYEYEQWCTIYKYKLKEGDSNLKSMKNSPMCSKLPEDTPKEVETLFNKALNKLMKFDRENWKKRRIDHYPHPLQITLKGEEWKVNVSKNYHLYHLESFEKLDTPKIWRPSEELPF